MAARTARTLGSHATVAFCGISPQVLVYRAATGKVRVWRRTPTLRFRLRDLIENRERIRIKDPRGRKPILTKAMETILT